MQEDKRSESSHFITLTYDTKYVPITRNGFMEISKRDVQLFFKRLRQNIVRGRRVACTAKTHNNETEVQPVRYYAVGEYGGKYNRPHYHLILFNADLELIEPAWEKGHIYYGTVTNESVGYCLKYMCKKPKIPMHRNDDRQREFSLMSKGLGENYMTPAMNRWHKKDIQNRQYCNLTDGKKISMPRYYKMKMYDETQRQAIAYAARKRAEDYQNHLESTTTVHERLEADKQAFRKMWTQAERGRDRVT